MSRLSHGGCRECPLAAPKCLAEHLTPESEPNSWNPSYGERVKEMETSAGFIRRSGVPSGKFTSARALQGGRFAMDEWPSYDELTWDKEGAGLIAIELATKARVGSLKYGKEVCSACVADCPTKYRKNCSSILNSETLTKIVSDEVSRNSGWDPEKISWKDPGLNAFLALSGETYKFNAATGDSGERSRKWHVGQVFKPNRATAARMKEAFPKERVPREFVRYSGLVVKIHRPHKRLEYKCVPLGFLLRRVKGACRTLRRAPKQVKRNVPGESMPLVAAYLASCPLLNAPFRRWPQPVTSLKLEEGYMAGK